MMQPALAEELGLSVQSVNLIIKGKTGITAETGVRLSRVFKNSAQFWLSLQMDWDLWHAETPVNPGWRINLGRVSQG